MDNTALERLSKHQFTFFGNSTECLRRFRSVSPTFKPQEEHSFTSSQSNSCHVIQSRSQSNPSQSLIRTDSLYYLRQNQPLSTERKLKNETTEDETEFKRPSQDQTLNNSQGKNSPRLQIKKQQSGIRLQTKQSQTAQRPRSRSKIKLNKKVAAGLNQYFLQDSTPKKKENIFNVFDYYSKQYEQKDSRVIPHLQPHNLKPYGMGENLVFPTHNKSRSIKYPVMEPEYADQVAKKTKQKQGEISDKVKMNYSTSRDFCTTSASNEQIQTCNQLLSEYRKLNPEYVTSNKKISLVPGTSKEADFLQKTMKFISEFQCQQVRRKPTSIVSKDLEKCNQVISEYKKCNPDYKPVKKEIKSGSHEEKKAVNQAINFAAGYKTFGQNNSKQETQNSQFPLKNRTASECLIKDHKKWSSNTSEDLVQSEEFDEAAPNLLNRNSLPNVQGETFSEDVFNLPEVPVKPIRVKAGAKANLLQGSALPEVASLWDNIQLEENETICSPWPSYADQLEKLVGPTKTPREVIYPTMPDNSKILKNTRNAKLQTRNVQPKLELSTCSLHKAIKFADNQQVVIKDEEPCKKNYSREESLKKGTSTNNLHRSFSNTRYTVRRYSNSSKGTFCDEKTVSPKRSKSKDVCDTIEFESPPTPTDFFTSDDCGCVEPKLPLDVPPLTRLKKRSIPQEPSKICPIVKPCTTPRADAGFQTKSKKLPKIISAKDCPCVEVKLKTGSPLPRLKKTSVEEPPKICPPCTSIKCNCPSRSDVGMKVKKKALQKLTPSKDCPCIDPIFKDVAPLKPLKKVKILEPQKKCLVPRLCDAPRADEKLKLKKKHLPKVTASNCPCVKEKPLKTVFLGRLKKVEVEEPPKICITVKPCENPYRADGKIKVPQKSLPPLEAKECSCINPDPPLDVKPLTRLKKRSNPVEPPKKCPKAKNPCALPRADDKLKSGLTKLPQIKYGTNCPCIEVKLKEGRSLSRLKKASAEEPPKTCPPCTDIKCNCPPRADQCVEVEKKRLPQLKIGNCPCVEPKIPIDVPSLKPLKKVKIEEPGKVCFVPPDICSQRADDKMVTNSKKLPKLIASNCECVDDEPLKDVPLPRLKKAEVCKPNDACPEEKDPCDPSETDRADEICKYKIKMKTLPPMLLKSKNNHVSVRSYNNRNKGSKNFQLNTSHKRRFSSYSEMNNSWTISELPSTINYNLNTGNSYSRISRKDCMKKEHYTVDEIPKLKRLPKFKKEDIDWSKMQHCSRGCRCGSSRGDANWKTNKKRLPRLVVRKFPRVDNGKLYSKKNQSLQKRLPKVKIYDVDLSKLKPCSHHNPSDNWITDKRSLSKLKSYSKNLQSNKVDLTPLKRLSKFGKEDKNWKQSSKCITACARVSRADGSLKPKNKFLPELTPRLCLNVELPEKTEKDTLMLKRLVKLQDKEDLPKVRTYEDEAPSRERAEELLGYECKKKKLPLHGFSRKGYHTVVYRHCSSPSYSIYGNVVNVRRQMFNTTSTKNISNRPKNNSNVKNPKKDCKKLGTKKENTCPKRNSLPRCKPKVRETCQDEYKPKECKRQKSPYPSFSECGEMPEWPKCECTDTELKFLQPKYPILNEISLLPPPSPDFAQIDIKPEMQCAMHKLGMKDEGETKTCENFNDPPKEIKGMELLKAETKKKAEAKGTSPTKVNKMCFQHNPKTECPTASVEKCKKSQSKQKCAVSASSKPVNKNTKCKLKSETSLKSATKNKTKSPSKPAGKLKPKSAPKSKSKASIKFASSSGPPAVIRQEQSKGLIARILAFFTSKPQDTGKAAVTTWKRTAAEKKSTSTAGKTSTAAEKRPKAKTSSESLKPKKSKSIKDTKPPQTFCASEKNKGLMCGRKSNKKANACKAPTKKNASKVKKTPALKKCKTKTAKPCSKSKFKCSTKKNEKPAETPSNEKCGSKGTKPKWQTQAEEKGQFAKKFKEVTMCSLTKDKTTGRAAKEKDTFECPPDENENNKNKFEKMFPPDMPDCTPRRRIRRPTLNCPPLPKCIPMDECRRLLKSWRDDPMPNEQVHKVAQLTKMEVCKVPELKKPKETVCQKEEKSERKVCKPEKKVCKPKNSEKKECKPKKDDSKAAVCNPTSKTESKCQQIKSNCPPKERESCEYIHIFKKCTAQESPYPSFSECRPPFPQLKVDECVVARRRAKATLSVLRKRLEKRKKNQDDDDKGNRKGRRSYSTMCAVARAMAFHIPTQWRRYYSSSTGGRGPKYFSQSLDKTKKKSNNNNEESNIVLNQRLLASIEEGIEKLESQDIDLPNNLYYQVLKALQKLSEKEIYEFFDQEAQFNPLCQLKGDVSETVSFVCKLNSRAEQTLFANNDIFFQPRCVGISDPNALSEEIKVIEAFKNLCRKLCEEADYHDIPYEELERLKTEDMKRELDELIRQSQNEQQ